MKKKNYIFRLRASRVLLVGIKGIGAEICKNLVLSGVKSITLMDFGQVDEQDFVAQFLVQREDLGKSVSVRWKCGLFALTYSTKVEMINEHLLLMSVFLICF